jgi:hypothetical protein
MSHETKEHSQLPLSNPRISSTPLNIPIVKCRNPLPPSLRNYPERTSFIVPSSDFLCDGENIPIELLAWVGFVPSFTSGGEYELAAKCDDFTLIISVGSGTGRYRKKHYSTIGPNNYFVLRSGKNDDRAEEFFLNCVQLGNQNDDAKQSFQIGVSFSDVSTGALIIGHSIRLSQVSKIVVKSKQTTYDIVGILSYSTTRGSIKRGRPMASPSTE